MLASVILTTPMCNTSFKHRLLTVKYVTFNRYCGCLTLFVVSVESLEIVRYARKLYNNNNNNSFFNLGFTMFSHHIKLELFRPIQ